MKKYQKEIAKSVAKEILLSIFDMAVPFFQSSHLYRKSASQYLLERAGERSELLEKIRYWKRMGYVTVFIENKEKYFELTPKGHKYLKQKDKTKVVIPRPNHWDGKWRIVIFDISEKLRASRDALRSKLAELGFFQIQKSVYVYPFECTEAISLLSKRYFIENSVLIMISEIIQGEEKIIELFLGKGILNDSDLKRS